MAILISDFQVSPLSHSNHIIIALSFGHRYLIAEEESEKVDDSLAFLYSFMHVLLDYNSRDVDIRRNVRAIATWIKVWRKQIGNAKILDALIDPACCPKPIESMYLWNPIFNLLFIDLNAVFQILIG